MKLLQKVRHHVFVTQCRMLSYVSSYAGVMNF